MYCSHVHKDRRSRPSNAATARSEIPWPVSPKYYLHWVPPSGTTLSWTLWPKLHQLKLMRTPSLPLARAHLLHSKQSHTRKQEVPSLDISPPIAIRKRPGPQGPHPRFTQQPSFKGAVSLHASRIPWACMKNSKRESLTQARFVVLFRTLVWMS